MKSPVAARAALAVTAAVTVLLGCAVPSLKEHREPVTRFVFSDASPLTLHAVGFRQGADCAGARNARFGGPTAVLARPRRPWQTVAFRHAESSRSGLSACTGTGTGTGIGIGTAPRRAAPRRDRQFPRGQRARVSRRRRRLPRRMRHARDAARGRHARSAGVARGRGARSRRREPGRRFDAREGQARGSGDEPPRGVPGLRAFRFDDSLVAVNGRSRSVDRSTTALVIALFASCGDSGDSGPTSLRLSLILSFFTPRPVQRVGSPDRPVAAAR